VAIAQESRSLVDGQAVLRLPGGVRWVAQHGGADPPHVFVDELTSLPLRWRHTHRFTPDGPGYTSVHDEVDTSIPAPLLRQMFEYRQRQLADDLAAHAWSAGLRGVDASRPLTVAMTGSSGTIGSALRAFLTTGGHRVRRLVRGDPTADDAHTWDPDRPDPEVLRGTDAVIHLGGAPIGRRFTEAHRRDVRDSRVGPTRRLAQAMARVDDGPRVLLTASAIGYYGARRGDVWLDEEGQRGGGFLSEVVAEWEEAADPARAAGIRVVNVRTGIVQSARGGMLRLLRPLFAAGLGGKIGSGAQWLSWIDVDDLLDVYLRALVDASLVGPVNAVAPEPVRNAAYTAMLGRVLRRPAVIRVPALGPRLVLGSEGADELALADQRVSPAVLQARSHRFRFPELEASLRHQLGHVRRERAGPTG
jgi:hypothetical protein